VRYQAALRPDWNCSCSILNYFIGFQTYIRVRRKAVVVFFLTVSINAELGYIIEEHEFTRPLMVLE
jgi:hypothetical protein